MRKQRRTKVQRQTADALTMAEAMKRATELLKWETFVSHIIIDVRRRARGNRCQCHRFVNIETEKLCDWCLVNKRFNPACRVYPSRLA